MPKFVSFKRARKNEAFIVYTFGIPRVSYRWTLMFPCFRYVHRVNIAFQSLHVDTDNIVTSDERIVGLSSKAKFRVDADSKEKVLKAYNEYSMQDGTKDDVVVDLSATVIDVITDVQEKAVAKLTLDELLRFNWVFADEVFMQAATALRENGVILVELTLIEVKEYGDAEDAGSDVDAKAPIEEMPTPDATTSSADVIISKLDATKRHEIDADHEEDAEAELSDLSIHFANLDSSRIEMKLDDESVLERPREEPEGEDDNTYNGNVGIDHNENAIYNSSKAPEQAPEEKSIDESEGLSSPNKVHGTIIRRKTTTVTTTTTSMMGEAVTVQLKQQATE